MNTHILSMRNLLATLSLAFLIPGMYLSLVDPRDAVMLGVAAMSCLPAVLHEIRLSQRRGSRKRSSQDARTRRKRRNFRTNADIRRKKNAPVADQEMIGTVAKRNSKAKNKRIRVNCEQEGRSAQILELKRRDPGLSNTDASAWALPELHDRNNSAS